MQLDFARAPTSPATDLARRLAPAVTKPTPRRRKKEAPPHWERGYRSHYYRNERGDKLGEVRLSDRGDLPWSTTGQPATTPVQKARWPMRVPEWKKR
jgi:hypothetical protein